MYEWILNEELDVDALIEAINSLNGLFERKEKLIEKKRNIEKSISDLQGGKTNLKAMLTFKSQKQELINQENQKCSSELEEKSLESIIQICCGHMLGKIDEFKKEKLHNYYVNLKKCADIQRENTSILSNLWTSVEEDKNINKLLD